MTVKPELDRSKWKIVSADSFQAGEGLPEHAIDNDPNTFWHSRWSPDTPTHPHELVIDFGEQLNVASGGLSGPAGHGKRPDRQLRDLPFKRYWQIGASRRPKAGFKTANLNKT